MKRFKDILLGGASLILAAVAAPAIFGASAASAADAVSIDKDDIGGVVRNPSGQPEAGVWVIAESHDLAVRYIKIVVTDDQGRYVIPDLPQANYQVSARLTQQGYINSMKSNGCVGCHQLGQLATRTIPALFREEQHNYPDMWLRRIQSGQGGMPMIQVGAGDLGGAAFKYLGDWTERVAKGELPKNKPPRPQGAERNIVITLRDWMNDKQYLHDLIASDRRYPTVNANGPLYGAPEYSSDFMPIL